MLEGGGKTPILSPFQLEELGFKIVAYPLSLLGVSIRAMQVFSLPRSCIVIFSKSPAILLVTVRKCR
jgi:hypothetical protein